MLHPRSLLLFVDGAVGVVGVVGVDVGHGWCLNVWMDVDTIAVVYCL